MKKPALIVSAACVVLAVLLSVVAWNAAWRYDTANLFVDGSYSKQSVQVRTHLISGRAERLTGYGWVSMEYKPSSVTQAQPSTKKDVSGYEDLLAKPSPTPDPSDPFAKYGR
jgi:hypothetical protein